MTPSDLAVRASFVVVTGLPGTGKSTLARALAPVLGLPVIDKDDDLEALFDERGFGSVETRRQLSRESDDRFRTRALEAGRGLLVSFWHLDGMPASSGTPTGWLDELPGPHVQVWCRCPIDEAARRFVSRSRHPGHADAQRPVEDVRAQLEATSRLEPLAFGDIVEVETSDRPDPVPVAEAILRAARGRA